MIRFVMTRGHAYVLEHLRRDPRVPRLEVVPYDRLIRARSAPRCVHVFTDFDRLGAWDLELAAAVHRCLAQAGVPVLNDPARVKTRFALLRALHEAGINDFNAYRLDEGIWPVRYPVFLRRAAGHRAPVSDLLEGRDALERAIERALEAGVPASSLLVVEYAGEPVAHGRFRKLAMHRVGERLVQQLSANDAGWLVKYGKRGFAPPEFYREELGWMRRSPFADALWRAFEVAGIEWGRADFGLLGGRVQVFEINTNPHVPLLDDHPVAERVESARLAFGGICEALRDLDGRASGGPRVGVLDPRLEGARRTRNLLVRSRVFP
jgi:hypothetical protein